MLTNKLIKLCCLIHCVSLVITHQATTADREPQQVSETNACSHNAEDINNNNPEEVNRNIPTNNNPWSCCILQ